MNNTIVNFIANVNGQTKDVFRKLAAIGFTPDMGLSGRIYTQFTGDKSRALVNPEGITFGLKFAAMKDMGSNKIVGSFMLTRGPLDLVVPLAITSALPENTEFPVDNHLRWRTSAPMVEGKLYGYLTNGNQTMEIDPEKFNLDAEAIDMQIVYAGGYFHLHVLTAFGSVYESRIKPQNIVTNGYLPKPHKLKENVTSVLTAPQKGELIAFFGTRNGVYFGNQLIEDTKGLEVADLVVDSENPRIFVRTVQGKIYALPVDLNFLLTHGKLIEINDTMQDNEQLFAGPGVFTPDKQIALLAINWIPENDGFHYEERTIAVSVQAHYPIEYTPRIRA